MGRGVLILAALLAAGCGDGRPGREEGLTPDEIERLSTPKEDMTDPNAAARPQPLVPADLARGDVAAPGCDFSRSGRTLLRVDAGGAIVRIAGKLHRFRPASPVGPTGGFFTAGAFRVSVGRTAETGAAPAPEGSWPARMITTNRRRNAQVELDGIWRCGA